MWGSTHVRWGDARHRALMGATAVASFLLLVWVGSGGAQLWESAIEVAARPSLGDGVVGGAFVTGAGAAAVITWRRHGGAAIGWVGATGGLLAAQALVVTLLAMQSTAPREAGQVGALVATALVGMVVVLAAIRRLGRVEHVVDDAFAIGIGMGIVAAGHLLLQFPIVRPAAPLVQVVFGVLVGTHVAVVAAVLLRRRLRPAVAWLLVLTVLGAALGQLVHVTSAAGAGLEPLAVVVRAATGAAWLGLAWVSLRRALEEDRRRITTFERVLVDTTRDQRERMHELRSTIAGLVSGSELLDRDDVPADVRERLWCSVRRELDRMERLLAGQHDAATEIDLDEALGMILDLQRLKGRNVELRSSGDVVRARFDSLAEVVNVLMDNAVKHGGTDSSLIEVVPRDEDNVDIRVTDYGRGIPVEQRTHIFEWGGRGTSEAPGEGIGLHVAQRLVREDGGTLQLADEAPGTGSSFVITLPRARRPLDDATTTTTTTEEDSRVCRSAW